MYELLERTRWATWVMVGAFVLSLVAAAPLIAEALFGGLWATPLVAAVIVAAFGAAYLFGSHGVLARFKPRMGEGPARRKAEAALEDAAICSGVSAPPLILLDTCAMNAGVMGDQPGRRVLITTTATVEDLDADELRAVFAHEMAHFFQGDTSWYPVMTSLVYVGRFVAGVGAYGLLALGTGLSRAPALYGTAGEGIFFLAAVLFFFVLIPALARLAQVAFMRTREFEADARAVLMTRDPLSLPRALVTMDERLNAVPGAGAATSHVFGMPPEGTLQLPLLDVHPPVSARLERLRMANPASEELDELVGEYFEKQAARNAERAFASW